MLNLDDYQNSFQLLTAAVKNKERIAVTLVNGKMYEGKISSIGDGHIIIKAIAGKEFYDAFIFNHHICSVEVRAREN